MSKTSPPTWPGMSAATPARGGPSFQPAYEELAANVG